MHSNAINVRTRRADLAGTDMKDAPPNLVVPARKRQQMVGLSFIVDDILSYVRYERQLPILLFLNIRQMIRGYCAVL